MNAKKLYFLLLGGIGLSILILFAGVWATNAFLQNRSKSLVAAKTKTAVLDEKQQQLIKQRADITKYKSLADIAKHIVPQDKDQAQTVREIVTIANDNGIKLGSITFPSSSLGGSGSSKSGLSQLVPVKGIAGVYSLDIIVQSDNANPVPYARFLDFLNALEHNRRTALVSSITIVPDNINPGKLTFTLNLSEYIKP